jgi:hypothetical protein
MNGNKTAALFCAIRGPLLLITLGTLFALAQFPVGRFGPYSFSRTWPVLLIVYGFLKLLEYASGPRGSSAGGEL